MAALKVRRVVVRGTVRSNGCWALGLALLVVTAAVVTAEAGTTGKTKDTAVAAAQRGNTPIPVLVRIDTEAIETVAASSPKTSPDITT